MNNNTVTFIKLKEIFQDLWTRITTVFEYFEKDKASLTKNNVFVGENTFSDAKLFGKKSFVETQGQKQIQVHSTGRYCGYRTVSTHSDGSLTPRYVSSIRIDVHDGLNAGDTVAGVHIVAVEKRADKLTDIVGDKITDGGSFVVEKDSNGQNVIYVPVEKEYTADTYFLIGQSGMAQMAQACYVYTQPTDESINGLLFENLPAKGEPLAHSHGVNWVVRHALTSDTINIRKELEELNKKIINAGGGTVTSVNGVNPQQDGNIVLTSTITHPNNNILLQVGNQNFATLECMTDQEAAAIIDGFTL